MDKINENLGEKELVKYVKLILIALLFVMEILICAQYATDVYLSRNSDVARLVSIVACCGALALFEVVDSFFAYRNLAVQMVFYSVETVLLITIGLLTGNAYTSILFSVVLTQLYISLTKFKDRIVIFCVSGVAYLASFISGWVLVNVGVSTSISVTEILGNCFFGLFLLTMDFVVINFLLRFYRVNCLLRDALREADESKVLLKDMYEELNRTAVFEERNRIAKDIHDNAGHSMTTVIMQTEAAKLLIDTDPEEAKNRIISANLQAKSALEQMRESVHLLAGRGRAETLKDEINEIIAQTVDGTDLKVRCDIDDVTVGEDKYRFICNTVKECLANGIRHGKATAFYIELKKAFGDINLLISDNGAGAAGKIKEGFGLRGIREKAEALGGKCVFSSEAGEGFEAEVTIPADKQEDI